jgi:hypothetical protein
MLATSSVDTASADGRPPTVADKVENRNQSQNVSLIVSLVEPEKDTAKRQKT